MELTRDGEALYMHCLPADTAAYPAKKVKSLKAYSKNTVRYLQRSQLEALYHRRDDPVPKYAKPGALLEQLLKEAQERGNNPSGRSAGRSSISRGQKDGYVRFLIED